MERRYFLTGVGVSSILSLSGCLDTGSNGGSDQTDTENRRDDGEETEAVETEEDGEVENDSGDADRATGGSDTQAEEGGTKKREESAEEADDGEQEDQTDEDTDSEQNDLTEDDPAEADRESRIDEEKGTEYESIVVFRNDDIQANYRPAVMRAVNEIFITEEVPVTLGIIPNMAGDAPLTDDPDLCDYLQSLEEKYSGQFEMALHGYEHVPVNDFLGSSEFGGLPYEDQRDRIAAGEELLADCVASPSSTFIPPYNSYDKRTVEILDEADYNALSSATWVTSELYGIEQTHFKEDGIIHISNTQSFEKWHELEDSDGPIAEDVPFHDLDTLLESFDEAHAANEIHVVMLHYQYFTTDERLNQLESLIQYMKAKEGVKFMTLEQLTIGLETNAVDQIDDGWHILEPVDENML